MRHPRIKDLPASVQRRLLDLARRQGRPYDEVLQYYVIQRFLYRLSQSRYRDRFVLKGALLFQVWGLAEYRPTRDIDLLGMIGNGVDELVRIIGEICSAEVEDDGIVFEPGTVRGEHITEDADYEGVRIRLGGRLGNVRLHVQIDVGFSDVVSPAPGVLRLPSLLGMPSGSLASYPAETVIAEKLQAIVRFGVINSRMKDFYDVWSLASRLELEGSLLQTAVVGTFENRKTLIPERVAAFTEEFAADKQSQWESFLDRNRLADAPREFVDVIAVLRGFAVPLLEVSARGERFSSRWMPRGPWLLRR